MEKQVEWWIKSLLFFFISTFQVDQSRLNNKSMIFCCKLSISISGHLRGIHRESSLGSQDISWEKCLLQEYRISIVTKNDIRTLL